MIAISAVDLIGSESMNGTYSRMGAQLFVEKLQCHDIMLAFTPHPATHKGLFAWDFGTRGLSVMHFERVAIETKRKNMRSHDMCDFSGKNALPAPSSPSTIDRIIEAVDVLSAVVNLVYSSTVDELVAAARQFFLKLKNTGVDLDSDALDDLACWLDERFERFRTLFADGGVAAASVVKSEFSVSHPSYVEVFNSITSNTLNHLRLQKEALLARPTMNEQTTRRMSGANQARLSSRVPEHIINALPSFNGKSLCRGAKEERMTPRQPQLSRQGLQVAVVPAASSTTSGGSYWVAASGVSIGSSSQESASPLVSDCRSRDKTNVLSLCAIPRTRDQQDIKQSASAQTNFLGVCKPLASVSEAAARDGVHRDAVRRVQAGKMSGSDSNFPTPASVISEQGPSVDYSGHCYAQMIDDRMQTEIGRQPDQSTNTAASLSFVAGQEIGVQHSCS
ncbi:hypothetical protein FI667_g16781, partial [Globisporangium splendens]